MKIDLHIHTKEVKEGDGEKRNISTKDFVEKTQQVDIMAITNHNHFDLNQFNEFEESLDDKKQLWPGVELDIEFNNQRTHLIMIVNNKRKKDLEEFIQSMVQDVDKFIINLETLLEKIKANFSSKEAIFFVHYMKEPKINEETFKKIEKLFEEEKYIIFAEPTNYITTSIMLAHDFRALNGSDVKDWDDYDTEQLPNLKIPISSFEAFILLCLKDKKIIETHLNTIGTNNMKIEINKEEFTIPIKNDVNIIFGGKGTGKSEIINDLKTEYEKIGKEVQIYNSNNNVDNYKDLLENINQENNSSIIRNGCKETLNDLLNYSENLETDILKKYQLHVESKNKTKKIKKNKILTMKYTDEHRLDKEIKNDMEQLNKITKEMNEIIQKNRLNEFEKQVFKDTFENIFKELFAKLKNDYKKNYVINSTGKHVKTVKELITNKTQLYPKPNNIGFESLINDKLDFAKKSKIVLNEMDVPNQTKKILLGEIPDKGEIYQQVTNKVLKSKSEMKKDGYSSIREQRTLLKNICLIAKSNMINMNEYISGIKEALNELNIEISLESLEGFKSVTIRKDDGKEYTPSKGETAILLVNRLIDNLNFDVYLFDEIEVGFENNYISNSVIPRIKRLEKRNKTIVLATHNANIATHLYPLNTIYREYSLDKYNTYVGNMFTGELVNTIDENDNYTWLNKTLHVLEGSEEAFEIRKDIYGK